ncbi:MAG: hypothetical protein FJY51_08725 [Betaproteobacteria bacterium]|nr:hypothetical protein [Betaproteobacteria bacterium]
MSTVGSLSPGQILIGPLFNEPMRVETVQPNGPESCADIGPCPPNPPFNPAQAEHLLPPRERAVVKFGIKPGMKVRFRFDGEVHTGIVNRISKRATVLVENERGQRYTNGKHYAKFYVPVQSLEAVE